MKIRSIFFETLKYAVLAHVLCLGLGNSVKADVTVKVVADEPPYIHAWWGESLDDEGAGNFGTQITETVTENGVIYYTKTYSGVDKINLIFSMNTNTKQTDDIYEISDGAYFQYDGNKTAFGIVPDDVQYIGSHVVAYYVNTNKWDGDIKAYFWDNSNVGIDTKNTGWDNFSMTKVGTDKAGYDIYRIDFGTYTTTSGYKWLNLTSPKTINLRLDTDSRIQFHIGNDIKSEVFYFENYGYYTDHYNGTGTDNNPTSKSLLIDGWSAGTTMPAATFNAIKAKRPTLVTTSSNGTEVITTSVAIDLDISESSLTATTGLAQFTNLRSLNASGNSSLGSLVGVNSCSHLKYIDFSGCDMVPGTFVASGQLASANQPYLEYLDVSNDKLSSQGVTLTNFSKLKTVKVADNSTWAQALTVTGSPLLESVDVSNNAKMTGVTVNSGNLTSISDITGLADCAALTTLNLDGNNISDVTALESAIEAGSLPKLADLFLNANDVSSIALNNSALKRVNLSENTNLTTVDLSNNGITCAAFSNCSSLKSLNLSNNNIDIIAQNYGGTTYSSANWGTTYNTLYINSLSQTFDYLDLSNNNFTSVDCTRMPDAKELDMSGNAITSMTFTKFASLEKLDVSNNAFTANVDIKQSPDLVWLNISGNTKITGFNGSTAPIVNIDNCSKLVYLDATGCSKINSTANLQNVGATLDTLIMKDCSIFDGFGSTTAASLTKLRYLDLSGCYLYAVNMSSSYLPANIETLHFGNPRRATITSVPVSNLSKLKYLTINDCAARVTSVSITDCPALIDLELKNDPGLTDLTLSTISSLKNLDVSENSNLKRVAFSGNTSIEEVDVTNCPSLTTLGFVNCGLSNDSNIEFDQILVGVDDGTGVSTTTNLKALDLSQNSYSSIPTIPAMFEYLYLQENEFDENLTLDGDAVSLKGIALSNKATVNPIKTFNATVASITPDEWAIDFSVTPPVLVQSNSNVADGSNTVLEAINLNGNSSLEKIKVNGFKGITKLASGDDMTTAAGKGLFIKGLTSLKSLDISNNRIELLGQDNTFNGLSGLDTLIASHNKIFTLTNKSKITANKNARSEYGDGDYTNATCSQLEDLTGLKKLDLSYNLLCDSVHLWKNTNLEWLDVSHNRIITPNRGVGSTLYYLDPKTRSFVRFAHNYTRVADKYTGDTNDTIGLRMLDLYFQTKLKYLDISYTSIQNTAQDARYINNRVGPENLTSSQHITDIPHFVLLNHCEDLVNFYCNYNGMKSFGIGSVASYSSSYGYVTGCPNLEYVEAKGMRGQDPKTMQGELRISAHNPKVTHYDVSEGNFDYIGKAYGADVSHLTYLNVSGNYTTYNNYVYDRVINGTDTTYYKCTTGNNDTYRAHGKPYELDVHGWGALDTLLVENTPYLESVNANNNANLSVISVAQDTQNNTLKELYVGECPDLSVVGGLNTLNHLEAYHAYDSHFTGEFVMPSLATSTLKDLRIYNSTLGNAETLNNISAVDLGNYSVLERVEVQNNPLIDELDIDASDNTLAHLDFANCHIDNTGINFDGASALTYLNASNDSPASDSQGNWLTDLDITDATGIEVVNVKNNEIYKLTLSGNNITSLNYDNNHVNGADLSSVPSTATISNVNNGRQIKANKSTFTKDGTTYDLYYFQVADDIDPNFGGSYLLTQQTTPYLHINDDKRQLNNDGFVLANVTWPNIGNTSPLINGKMKAVNATPDVVDENKIYGNIVVLDPSQQSSRDASLSSVSYQYNNGNGTTSTYYLDYSASDVVTAIENIPADGQNQVSVTPSGNGTITINAAPGTELGVFDMAGRLVQRVTVDQNGEVTVDGLVPGIYIVGGTKTQVK